MNYPFVSMLHPLRTRTTFILQSRLEMGYSGCTFSKFDGYTVAVPQGIPSEAVGLFKDLRTLAITLDVKCMTRLRGWALTDTSPDYCMHKCKPESCDVHQCR
jgi:hypothetical protein